MSKAAKKPVKPFRMGKKLGELEVLSPVYNTNARGLELLSGYLCRCTKCNKAQVYRLVQLQGRAVRHCGDPGVE